MYRHICTQIFFLDKELVFKAALNKDPLHNYGGGELT